MHIWLSLRPVAVSLGYPTGRIVRQTGPNTLEEVVTDVPHP
jgi:hypothetical protein